MTPSTGHVVVLNGAPRAGKSSIAAAIQDTFDGIWMNIGVDHVMRMTPDRFQPGIGLRPGGERPDLEPLVVALYAAMYDAVAAHSRLGLNVVVDVGHHDAYSRPLRILPACARRLAGLPVLMVGVRCPIEVVMERRATWPEIHSDDDTVPTPVQQWQNAVHDPGTYDVEVDTSTSSPTECAELILQHLTDGPPPTALQRIQAF
jgi:chloramphenicol 3-O phosphotransferase